jgi:hypothetical protein
VRAPSLGARNPFGPVAALKPASDSQVGPIARLNERADPVDRCKQDMREDTPVYR